MSVRYPWPTLDDPPVLRIDDVRVDGTALPSALIDGEHQRIVLDGLGRWERFECTAVLESDGRIHEFDQPVGYVIASSPATAARVPFSLAGRPFTGDVALEHAELGRSFTLEAQVAARFGDRRRVVGSASPWTVVLDQGTAPVPAGSPPFETVWVDFGSDDAPESARRSPRAHAVMQVDDGPPRLLLNSAIDGFQALLHADTAQLERRRLRDLLGADVARHATSALFRAAVAEVGSPEGGTSPAPETGLYRQVCEAIAEVMPGVGSVEELYEQIAEERSNPSDQTALWVRVDVAIGALVGQPATIERVCSEVKYA